MNARLQVEHPVSELVTGLDVVREQLRIAAGEALPATGRASRSGHAIEIRINAEDPANGFAPSPGRIERLRLPGGPGVRLDTHVEAGSVVPPNYDSLIAKLCAWAPDRPAAIARGLRALGELEIDGIATTRDFAIDVLHSDAFGSGDYDTSFVDGHFGP
jgi:acetyl-CoA carboxylase, biotin carboxylase subunit